MKYKRIVMHGSVFDANVPRHLVEETEEPGLCRNDTFVQILHQL